MEKNEAKKEVADGLPTRRARKLAGLAVYEEHPAVRKVARPSKERREWRKNQRGVDAGRRGQYDLQAKMKGYFWIRAKLFLRQARWGFALIGAWFLLGTLIFRHAAGLSYRDAILNAVYLEKSDGQLWELYSFWGQCMLFGIVISIFFLQALQRYNPQEGCRMLAGEIGNHVIVVGYTHLGARIVQHLRDAQAAYVLIDQDAGAVDDLVRIGEPVIVDNAKQDSTLAAAGIEHAKTVIVATNNVETALLVTKKAREKNAKAHIIVRCYVDDFTEILETLGANEVISSSKSAFEGIAPRLLSN